MHCFQAKEMEVSSSLTAQSSSSGFVIPCKNIQSCQWLVRPPTCPTPQMRPMDSNMQVVYLQFISLRNPFSNWKVSIQIIESEFIEIWCLKTCDSANKTRFVIKYYARAASIRLLATCLRLRPVRDPATLSVAFSTSVLPALRMISTCVGWPW